MKKYHLLWGMGLLIAVMTWFLSPCTSHAGIGIAVPMGGGTSTETISDGESYAAVTMDSLAMEYYAVEKNGALHVELRIKNMKDTPIVYTRPTGQVYDFTLTDETGKEIWRWSDDMVFTQAFQDTVWQAGETVVYAIDIPRKEYKALKKNVVLVNVYLKETPYALSLRLAKAKKTVKHNSPIVIHGGWGRGYDLW